MKKIIPGILFLLLVALFVGSFVTGPMTQSAIEEQIAKINQMPGYKAELVEYQSGWRDAQGKIRVGFDWDLYANMSASDPDIKQKMQEMPAGLLLDVRVKHGPVLLQEGFGTGLAYIELRPDVSSHAELQLFQQKAGIPELFSYQTTIGLLGHAPFVFSSPAFNWVDENGEGELRYGGAQFAGSYNARSRRLIMNGGLAPLSFAGKGGTIQLSAIELVSDLELVNEMVSLGEMSMTMSELAADGELAEGPKGLGGIRDVLVRYHGERDGDETVSMQVQYGIGEITAGGEQVSNINLDMTFERLGIEPLMHYYEQLMALYENAAQAADFQQQQLANMAALGGEFLQYSPAMDISDVSFEWQGGRFAANARVAFDGEGDEMMPADLANPFLLMARLNVDSTVAVDQRLLDTLGVSMMEDTLRERLSAEGQEMSDEDIHEMAVSQLEAVLQQGFLLPTETGYKASFSMNKGAMQLNGQPFSPFGQPAVL